MAIADFFTPKDLFLKDYIRGTFTETRGIVLTIILIEFILNENRKTETNENSKKAIKRSISILNIYLKNYNNYAFNLAYKYEDYNTQRVKGLHKDFNFSNLSELFHRSPSMFDDFSSTKVGLYFSGLEDLKEIIKKTLYQTDLTNYPKFSELLLNYLAEMERFNPKDGILSDLRTGSEDGKIKSSEVAVQMINEHQGELKYLPSNSLNKYIRLYEIINYNIEFHQKYTELIVGYKLN